MKQTNKIKGWLRVLLFVLPFLIVAGVFSTIGAYLTGVDIGNQDALRTTFQDLIITFFYLTGVLLLLWGFMKVIDKEPFINLGFRIKNKQTEIFMGVIIGVFIMAIGYVLLIQLDEISFSKYVFDFENLVYTLGLFVFVAIAEEVVFRGYVLRNLMYSFNNYLALLVSAALFAIMHGANPNMDYFSIISLLLAGILLGITYIYTKNLWFPIALHFSWNFFQTLFGFNVSGQDFYSLVEFNMIEKNRLNGGDFGFEGSVLSTFIMAILILFIWRFYTKANVKDVV